MMFLGSLRLWVYLAVAWICVLILLYGVLFLSLAARNKKKEVFEAWVEMWAKKKENSASEL